MGLDEKGEERAYLTSPFFKWSMSTCIPSGSPHGQLLGSLLKFGSFCEPSLSIPVANVSISEKFISSLPIGSERTIEMVCREKRTEVLAKSGQVE